MAAKVVDDDDDGNGRVYATLSPAPAAPLSSSQVCLASAEGIIVLKLPYSLFVVADK